MRESGTPGLGSGSSWPWLASASFVPSRSIFGGWFESDQLHHPVACNRRNDGTLPRGGRSPCRRRRSPCPPECISRPPFPSFQVAHLARASLSAVNEKTRLQSHTALAARALAS